MSEELIARIVREARIPSTKRRDVARELRAHFEDSDGVFGDPEEIAREFARVYRFEWMRARAAVTLLSVVIVASVVTAIVLAAQAGIGMKVLWNRHAVFEVRDIVAVAAVYLGLSSFRDRALVKPVAMLALLIAAVTAVAPAGFLVFGLAAGIFLRVTRGWLAVVAGAGIGLFEGALASWLLMGAGYYLMTVLAPRVESVLRERLA